MRVLLAFLACCLSWIPMSASAEFGVGDYEPGGHLEYSGAQIDAAQHVIQAAGARLAYIGDFISFDPVPEWGYEPLDHLDANLETAWSRGIVPVVNLMRWPLDTSWPNPGRAHLSYLTDPSTPEYERMYAWALKLAAWGKRGGGRYMYLAPFPEHNGGWVSYYDPDPHVFIQAFQTFAWILAHYAGSTVRLVWAPMLMPGYEAYDPTYYHTAGGSLYGAQCGEIPGTYAGQVAPLVHSLQWLAHGRPILLTQVGTPIHPEQERWAHDLFLNLPKETGVIGAMWWSIPDPASCSMTLTPQQWINVLKPLDWRK